MSDASVTSKQKSSDSEIAVALRNLLDHQGSLRDQAWRAWVELAIERLSDELSDGAHGDWLAGAQGLVDACAERRAHETKAVRDSIAPNKQCPKCQRFFWLDKFDGHDCRPQKASEQSKLTHKAGDICEVCGGAWVSVSNVGGVAHICPGSPLNGPAE